VPEPVDAHKDAFGDDWPEDVNDQPKSQVAESPRGNPEDQARSDVRRPDSRDRRPDSRDRRPDSRDRRPDSRDRRPDSRERPDSRDRRPDSRDRRRSGSSHGGYRSKSPARENYEDKRDVNPDTFTQVYLARLDRRTGQSDIENAFGKFGSIRSITLKNFYAFVDFEEHSAAVAAIKEMNGVTFVNGEYLNVAQSSKISLTFEGRA